MKQNGFAKSKTPESDAFRAYVLIQSVPGRVEGI